jgi:hypothetical protein
MNNIKYVGMDVHKAITDQPSRSLAVGPELLC